MQISIRYEGDGVRRAWVVPFPYGGPADLRVALTSDGAETVLVHGEDYKLMDHAVICAVPQEEALSISLVSPLARACALQEERVQAAELAGMNEERAVWIAQAAAQIAEDAAELARKAALQAKESLAAEIDSTLEAGLAELAAAKTELLEKAQAGKAEALADIWQGAAEAISRAHNPGLAALCKIVDISAYSEGFFIINPYLEASTRFMGVWPARDENSFNWDGFFVIIPTCPGHDYNAAKWDNPGGSGAGSRPQTPATGSDYNWWLSCGHQHGWIN